MYSIRTLVLAVATIVCAASMHADSKPGSRSLEQTAADVRLKRILAQGAVFQPQQKVTGDLDGLLIHDASLALVGEMCANFTGKEVMLSASAARLKISVRHTSKCTQAAALEMITVAIESAGAKVQPLSTTTIAIYVPDARVAK